MFKYIIGQADSMSDVAIVAMVFFFLFFLAVGIMTIKLDKKTVASVEKLPLEDGRFKTTKNQKEVLS